MFFAAITLLLVVVQEPAENPLSRATMGLVADDVASITVELFVDSDKEGWQFEDVDVTDAAEGLLKCLHDAKFHGSGGGLSGPPAGKIRIKTKGGKSISVSCYGTSTLLFFSDDSHFYGSHAASFVQALRYDRKNRAFSEAEYQDLLLGYAESKDGNIGAFRDLAVTGDRRSIALIPTYLTGKNDNDARLTLYSLDFLRDVEDRQAFDSVVAYLDNGDGHLCRAACRVLKTWGRLDALREIALAKREPPSELFTSYVAEWFAEQGHYLDAIKTVRTQGLEHFDFSRSLCLLQPIIEERFTDEDEIRWSARPMTAAEKRAVFLLFADIVEQRGDELYVVFIGELWDAMGVEYDFDKKAFVSHKEGESGTFFRDLKRGKEVAGAMRTWCDAEFPEEPPTANPKK